MYACRASKQWLNLFHQSVSVLNHFDTVNMTDELIIQKRAVPFKLASLYTDYITNAYRWVFRAEGTDKDQLTISIKVADNHVQLLDVRPKMKYHWTIVIGVEDWKMYTEINGKRTYVMDVPHTEHYSIEKYGHMTCTGHVSHLFALEDKMCDLTEPNATQSWEEYILENTDIKLCVLP